jgi:SAM-dependent methyltransferase
MWRERWMRVAGISDMRADFGWLHYLLHFVAKLPDPARGQARKLQDRLRARTDERSAAFDREYGVETFVRSWVQTERDGASPASVWGYGPINQGFFREMMRAVPVPLGEYTFVDIGAGKGAAVLMASEFGFDHYIGIDLHGHLLEVARQNVTRFNQRTGRALAPEWIEADILEWPITERPALFFLNDPFPAALSAATLARITDSLREQPRKSLLVYRKPPAEACAVLRSAPLWRPLRITPYWRIYAAA